MIPYPSSQVSWVPTVATQPTARRMTPAPISAKRPRIVALSSSTYRVPIAISISSLDHDAQRYRPNNSPKGHSYPLGKYLLQPNRTINMDDVWLPRERPTGWFECIGRRRSAWCTKLNSATELIQRHQGGSPMQTVYYIGLDVHKRTITLPPRGLRQAH